MNIPECMSDEADRAILDRLEAWVEEAKQEAATAWAAFLSEENERELAALLTAITRDTEALMQEFSQQDTTELEGLLAEVGNCNMLEELARCHDCPYQEQFNCYTWSRPGQCSD